MGIGFTPPPGDDSGGGSTGQSVRNTPPIIDVVNEGDAITTFTSNQGNIGDIAVDTLDQTIWIYDSNTGDIRQYTRDGTETGEVINSPVAGPSPEFSFNKQSDTVWFYSGSQAIEVDRDGVQQDSFSVGISPASWDTDIIEGGHIYCDGGDIFGVDRNGTQYLSYSSPDSDIFVKVVVNAGGNFILGDDEGLGTTVDQVSRQDTNTVSSKIDDAYPNLSSGPQGIDIYDNTVWFADSYGDVTQRSLASGPIGEDDSGRYFLRFGTIKNNGRLLTDRTF